MKQNWYQFLLVVKATPLKQQIAYQNFIRRFKAQTDANDQTNTFVLGLCELAACRRPKCAIYLLCLEFADKILIFAVLKWWLFRMYAVKNF